MATPGGSSRNAKIPIWVINIPQPDQKYIDKYHSLSRCRSRAVHDPSTLISHPPAIDQIRLVQMHVARVPWNQESVNVYLSQKCKQSHIALYTVGTIRNHFISFRARCILRHISHCTQLTPYVTISYRSGRVVSYFPVG